MKIILGILFFAIVLNISLALALEEVASFGGSLDVGHEGGVINISTGGEQAPFCGNNIIEIGEQCDGSNLNGATCSSLLGNNFTGSLSCKPNCIYDASLCRLIIETPPIGGTTTGGSSGGGSGGGGGGRSGTTTVAISSSESAAGGCVENWECQEWSRCIAGEQVRICSDKNNCSTIFLKPLIGRLCESKAIFNDLKTEDSQGIIGTLLGAVIGVGENKYNASIILAFILFIVAAILLINLIRSKQRGI